jgi:hypothetical protein
VNWADDPLIALIRGYYEKNEAGGSLHIALDDGNLDDDAIWWCVEWAAKRKDLVGVQIACWLLALSEEVRFDLYENYSLYAYAPRRQG